MLSEPLPETHNPGDHFVVLVESGWGIEDIRGWPSDRIVLNFQERQVAEISQVLREEYQTVSVD